MSGTRSLITGHYECLKLEEEVAGADSANFGGDGAQCPAERRRWKLSLGAHNLFFKNDHLNPRTYVIEIWSFISMYRTHASVHGYVHACVLCVI